MSSRIPCLRIIPKDKQTSSARRDYVEVLVNKSITIGRAFEYRHHQRAKSLKTFEFETSYLLVEDHFGCTPHFDLNILSVTTARRYQTLPSSLKTLNTETNHSNVAPDVISACLGCAK